MKLPSPFFPAIPLISLSYLFILIKYCGYHLSNSVHDAIWLQGHPTEYFGKISVQMEGGLKFRNFILSDALDFSIFFGKPFSLEFSELMHSLLSRPIIFGRFSLFFKIFVWGNNSKSC